MYHYYYHYYYHHYYYYYYHYHYKEYTTSSHHQPLRSSQGCSTHSHTQNYFRTLDFAATLSGGSGQSALRWPIVTQTGPRLWKVYGAYEDNEGFAGTCCQGYVGQMPC